MKIFFLVLFFALFASCALITGDQSKVSITGGNGWVESKGVRKSLDSGEIIYINENTIPSDSQKITVGDLNNIYRNLKPSTDEKLINIQYFPVKNSVARNLKKDLTRFFSNNSRILLKKINSNETEIFLLNIDIKKIERIYPQYYRAAVIFYLNKANEDQIPTLKMQLRHLYFYHKKLFNDANIYLDEIKLLEKDN